MLDILAWRLRRLLCPCEAEVPHHYVRGMVHARGREEGKQGRREIVSGNGTHCPSPLFPLLSPMACHHSAKRRQELAEPPTNRHDVNENNISFADEENNCPDAGSGNSPIPLLREGEWGRGQFWPRGFVTARLPCCSAYNGLVRVALRQWVVEVKTRRADEHYV